MERVLQISTCNSFRGIEKLELEIFENINEIKFDFLTPNNTTFKDKETIINELGGKYYNFNIDRNTIKNKLIYSYRLYKFLKTKKYKIIHINSTAFFFILNVALIAKLCRVRKVIMHTHSIRKINKFKKIFISILNPLLFNLTDEHLSCSIEVKKQTYNKKYWDKVEIINNGIELNKYKYSEKIREEYKNKLNINNKTVYGHIGSFDKRKNHDYLIDLFYKISIKQSNSILLLIGTGELEGIIKEKVKKLNIEDKVLFLGFRDDVYKLLNVIDIFIFPSLMEGFGIAAIESQANGIITYCSNNISKNVNISPYYRQFNLNDNIDKLSDKICNEKNNSNRKEAYKYIKKNGFDIKDTCNELKKIYLR